MTFDEDGRCPTCRQRNSRAGERDNGSWFCNVPWCANAADDLRRAPGDNTILGRVVEAGNVECLGGRPGLVIVTMKDQLRDFGRNVIGCEVEVRVRADEE